jgi:hypothetical protein
MAGTGILYDTVATVKDSLTALGLMPVTDPRNARPLSVFIELPTVTAFNYNVGDITLRLRILAAPPGNSDAGDYLMSVTDTILNSPIAVTDMSPGMVSIGGQDLPTYDLTVRVAAKRT